MGDQTERRSRAKFRWGRSQNMLSPKYGEKPTHPVGDTLRAFLGNNQSVEARSPPGSTASTRQVATRDAPKRNVPPPPTWGRRPAPPPPLDNPAPKVSNQVRGQNPRPTPPRDPVSEIDCIQPKNDTPTEILSEDEVEEMVKNAVEELTKEEYDHLGEGSLVVQRRENKNVNRIAFRKIIKKMKKK